MMLTPGPRAISGAIWVQPLGGGPRAGVRLWREDRWAFPSCGGSFDFLLGPEAVRGFAAGCRTVREQLIWQEAYLAARPQAVAGRLRVRVSPELCLEYRPKTGYVVAQIDQQDVFALADWELASVAGGLSALIDELDSRESEA